MTQLTVLRQRCTFSEAEVYLLMFIKAMTKLPPLADIDLRRTYRAIDSVATGRIPSLFCAPSERHSPFSSSLREQKVHGVLHVSKAEY